MLPYSWKTSSVHPLLLMLLLFKPLKHHVRRYHFLFSDDENKLKHRISGTFFPKEKPVK
jgi:hypothetical protein